MRLTAEQVTVIRQAVAEVLGDDAEVRLFGSRVDDKRKGGDIDLYIEVPALPDSSTSLLDVKTRLLQRLWQRLGPQRIDLLIRTKHQPMAGVHRHAVEHGVLL